MLSKQCMSRERHFLSLWDCGSLLLRESKRWNSVTQEEGQSQTCGNFKPDLSFTNGGKVAKLYDYWTFAISMGRFEFIWIFLNKFTQDSKESSFGGGVGESPKQGSGYLEVLLAFLSHQGFNVGPYKVVVFRACGAWDLTIVHTCKASVLTSVLYLWSLESAPTLVFISKERTERRPHYQTNSQAAGKKYHWKISVPWIKADFLMLSEPFNNYRKQNGRECVEIGHFSDSRTETK